MGDVKKYILILLLILFIPFSFAELSCYLSTTSTCPSDNTALFYLSSTTNSHINLNSGSKALCCNLPSLALYKSCDTSTFSVGIIGKTSSTTNGHFQKNTQNTYANKLCLSTNFNSVITCDYKNSCDTSQNETCLISMENKNSNSMVGDCAASNYQTKVCCKIEYDILDTIDCGGSEAIMLYEDNDHDGQGNQYRPIPGCAEESGKVLNHDDCDDTNSNRFLGNSEVCDGIDNDCIGAGMLNERITIPKSTGTEICNNLDDDCDGIPDNDLNQLWYKDADGDTFGNPSIEVFDCGLDSTYVQNKLDCNDGNPNIKPGIQEICNGIDDNCALGIDENVINNSQIFGECQQATRVCGGTSGWIFQNLPSTYQAVENICDGLDNDCDGQTDEGFDVGQSCTVTNDQCSSNGLKACNALGTGTYCDAPEIIIANEICDGLDNDCDGGVDEDFQNIPASKNVGVCTGALKICDYATGLVKDPDFTSIPNYEVNELSCDAYDNDCDGSTNEIDTLILLPSNKTEGVCQGLPKKCEVDGTWTEYGTVKIREWIESNTGYLGSDYTPNADSCGDNLDNNCNGVEDEQCKTFCDKDDDGYSDSSMNFFNKYLCGLFFPSLPITDCDDSNNKVFPNAPEICDGITNQCPGNTGYGQVDINLNEEAPLAINQNGICEGQYQICDSQIGEYVDPDFAVLLSALYQEVEDECDGFDNDCDGTTDESDYVLNTKGICKDNTKTCIISQGWIEDPHNIIPTEEKCNYLDDDCDGQIDEELDTGTVCSVGIGECKKEGYYLCDYAGEGLLCSATALTPNREVCNGLDDDCDGTIDNDRDCDGDLDDDGILNTKDPDFALNSTNNDDDNDGIPDHLDLDPDNDLDNDGINNEDDPDDDNDGKLDVEDNDDDNDGIPDHLDPDDDNDGVLDINEPYDINSCNSCEACGNTIFNLCDENECTVCAANANGCYYDTSWFNDCLTCDNLVCNSYINEDDCSADSCSLTNCGWNSVEDSCCPYFDGLTTTICGGVLPSECNENSLFLSTDNNHVCDNGVIETCNSEKLCEKKNIDGVTYECTSDNKWVQIDSLYNNYDEPYICVDNIKRECDETNLCQIITMDESKFFCDGLKWINQNSCINNGNCNADRYDIPDSSEYCILNKVSTCVLGDGCNRDCEDDLDCLLDIEFIVEDELTNTEFSQIFNKLRLVSPLGDTSLQNRIREEIDYQLEIIGNPAVSPGINKIACEIVQEGIQENCKTAGDNNCWVKEGLEDHQCCGPGLESWALNNEVACVEGTFSNDPDYNKFHCTLLRDNDLNNIQCENENDTYCYGEIIKDGLLDKNNLCCGDDPGESWKLFSSELFDNILVNANCINGKWKKESSNQFSYDIIASKK